MEACTERLQFSNHVFCWSSLFVLSTFCLFVFGMDRCLKYEGSSQRQMLVGWHLNWRLNLSTNIQLHFVTVQHMEAEGQCDIMVSVLHCYSLSFAGPKIKATSVASVPSFVHNLSPYFHIFCLGLELAK